MLSRPLRKVVWHHILELVLHFFLQFMITVHTSSCVKVMFSRVSVCPHGGGVHPPGQTPPWADTHWLGRHIPLGRDPLGRHTPTDTPRDVYCSGRATVVGSMHLTGMHSCFFILWCYMVLYYGVLFQRAKH